MKHVAPDILGKVAPRAVIQPPEPSLGFPRAFIPGKFSNIQESLASFVWEVTPTAENRNCPYPEPLYHLMNCRLQLGKD